MLLSMKWLREFVPFTGTAEELGHKLTMLGLELEEIARPFDDIADIVIGQVVTCEKHPEADKLSVCTVNVGTLSEEPLTIVCGAPNVAAGQRVPVAMVGTVMPGGMAIKKAKLRGVPSFGMICSERELGLSDDHSGIMVLPEDAPLGVKFVDYFDMDREVLNISITPNRADCTSVLGLAREVAVAYNLPLTMPTVALQEEGEDCSSEVKITIPDAELCPLYQGRIIENVRIAPSPYHIRYRLIACGIRPISNIVDVTNYVLLELGQPLHSFDKDKIRGGEIIVAASKDGEKLTTLDGQERTLVAQDITIRDPEGAIALAGTMGGLDSEITEASTAVFLESAVFRAGSVRKTARRLGLHSEASYRFERGVDQMGNTFAMDRAASLMVEFGGGSVRKGVCKAEPKPWTAPQMTFRLQRANDLLGLSTEQGMDAAFCEKVLTSLGCTVTDTDKAVWQVTGPSWRHDMEREADLIEEVGRVYGLDNIEPVLPVVRHSLENASALAEQGESVFDFWSRIKKWGRGLGLNEAINYSFVGHKDLDHLNLPTEGRVSIANPLSAEQDALRTALAPGLLQSLRHNLAQGNAGLRLFELAHIFTADATSETTAKEEGRLALLVYGQRYDGTWPQVQDDADYSDIKGLVEHLFTSLHLPCATYAMMEGHSYLLPAVSIMVDGTCVGVMGRVRPAMAEAFHAKKDVWMAELDLDVLRQLVKKSKIAFTSLAVYPPSRRDMTVMTDGTVSVDAILQCVSKVKLALLDDICVIDMFEPSETERNITFRLTFRHAERTLKDGEVDKEKDKIVAALTQGLEVRI